jgi:formylglycine-generating enzyme
MPEVASIQMRRNPFIQNVHEILYTRRFCELFLRSDEISTAMNRTRLLAGIIFLLFLFVPLAGRTQSVSINLSPINDIGNAPDPASINGVNPAGYGEVDYPFAIGTFDVTINQYTSFLNAVAATDQYGLYDPNLATETPIAGISRSGTAGSYSYSVIGNSGNNPITFVGWLDAARFCNWLQNGQTTTGVEGPGTTETGAYTLNGDISNGLETKNAGAQWWVPSEDEWYKAAYYDPTIGGTGGYWLYPTVSNDAPGNIIGSGTNEANYGGGGPGGLTPVGSFTNSASHYGTYDQGGDVFQLVSALPHRRIRGTDWYEGAYFMESIGGLEWDPIGGSDGIGFRVATVGLITQSRNVFSQGTRNVPNTIDALLNDTDTYGGPLTVVSVTQGSFGSVDINRTGANNAVVYTPQETLSGTDSFTCTVADSYGITSTETIAVYSFSSIQGTFSGITKTNGSNSVLTMSVHPSGAFVGSVTTDTANNIIRFSVTGHFDGTGNCAGDTVVLGKKNTFGLHLGFQTSGGETKNCIVSGSGSGLPLFGAHSVYQKGESVPEAGRYTFLISGAGDAVGLEGFGYATVTINQMAQVAMAGRLPDGESIGNAGIISSGTGPDQYVVYEPLRYPFVDKAKATGLLIGTLTFERKTGVSDCDGILEWIKPEQTRGLFNGAIDGNLSVIGSRYALERGQKILSGFNGGTLQISDQFEANVSKAVVLTAGNQVKIMPPLIRDLAMEINLGTGVFHGTFVYPATPSRPPTLTGFGGVLFQDQSFGEGYFLGPGGSGVVSLTTP